MTYVPAKNENGERRYGEWAGRPHGEPEDKARCIVQVPNPPAWAGAQCSRKRGYGPDREFCKQHAAKFTT